MIKVAPSILSANFNELGKEAERLVSAGADYLHVDVMDGQFVPNITIGPVVIQRLREITSLPLDVHLMIQHPEQFIEVFRKAGAAIIGIHYESTLHLDRALTLVRTSGASPCAVINPATPVELIFPVLPIVGQVLVMSVNPGFPGQQFIPYTLEKIRTLKKEIQRRQLNVMIQVDGGVNEQNIADLAQAGTDIVVAGSSVFNSPDMKKTIQTLKNP